MTHRDGESGEPQGVDPSEKPPEDSGRDLETFVATQQVIDLVFEYVATEYEEGHHGESDYVWMADGNRNGSVDPREFQTEQGLFLGMYGAGYPTELWTPWGRCQFGGSAAANRRDWGGKLPEILDRLGAELYKDGVSDDRGEFVGPVYKITKIDDKPLPDPKEREDWTPRPGERFGMTDAEMSEWEAIREDWDKFKQLSDSSNTKSKS